VAYFTPLPPSLAADVAPLAPLFVSPRDRARALNQSFVWVSGKGVTTHTHFDQDHNFFVQVVGRKRFTVFASTVHEAMYPYPRLLPLWHKSQVVHKRRAARQHGGEGDRPGGGGEGEGSARGGDFPLHHHALGVMQTIEVGPGDVLYIPPYTWHRVETLAPSISLALLSHETEVRDAMDTIYKLDHSFDKLQDSAGRRFALRLFLDVMVHELVGNRKDETQLYFQRLCHTRYTYTPVQARTATSAGTAAAALPGCDGELDHPPPAASLGGAGDGDSQGGGDGEPRSGGDSPGLCTAALGPGGGQAQDSPLGKVPTAQHVYGSVMSDARLVAAQFTRIGEHTAAAAGGSGSGSGTGAVGMADARDLLFADYVEDMAAEVLEAELVAPFFARCFRGQEYGLTVPGSDLHATLWRYYDEEEDGPQD